MALTSDVIVKDREILGGTPVFRRTRMPFNQLSPGRLRPALTDRYTVRFASVYAGLTQVGECYELRLLAANVDRGVNQIVHQLTAARRTEPSTA
jgi:hypothetical protein